MRRCPKCGERVSPLYFGIECPHCGVDLRYYDFDARLEADARKAAAQEEKARLLLTGIRRRRAKCEESGTREQ